MHYYVHLDISLKAQRIFSTVLHHDHSMKRKQKKFLINLLQNAKFAYNPVAKVTQILILTKCRNNFKLIVDKWGRED